MNLINYIILQVKLWYYTLADRWDNDISVELSSIPQRIQQRQNSKLMRGVKRLNDYLRSLAPSERTKPENLVGVVPYSKSAAEKLAELRVQEKVLNNPTLRTEDDLVNFVVRKAPIYALEQEVKQVRKDITACLRRSSADPSNPTHLADMKALRAKLEGLRGEIERLKRER